MQFGPLQRSFSITKRCTTDRGRQILQQNSKSALRIVRLVLMQQSHWHAALRKHHTEKEDGGKADFVKWVWRRGEWMMEAVSERRGMYTKYCNGGEEKREKKWYLEIKKTSERIRKWKREKRGSEGPVNYSSVRGHHPEKRDVMLSLL